jgi:hypothetical protein
LTTQLTELTDRLKVSIRLKETERHGSTVTSLSIKRNITALWILYSQCNKIENCLMDLCSLNPAWNYGNKNPIEKRISLQTKKCHLWDKCQLYKSICTVTNNAYLFTPDSTPDTNLSGSAVNPLAGQHKIRKAKLHVQEEEILTLKKLLNKTILNFIYIQINDWTKSTGKGLSEFMQERMIKEILDKIPLIEVKEKPSSQRSQPRNGVRAGIKLKKPNNAVNAVSDRIPGIGPNALVNLHPLLRSKNKVGLDENGKLPGPEKNTFHLRFITPSNHNLYLTIMDHIEL